MVNDIDSQRIRKFYKNLADEICLLYEQKSINYYQSN